MNTRPFIAGSALALLSISAIAQDSQVLMPVSPGFGEPLVALECAESAVYEQPIDLDNFSAGFLSDVSFGNDIVEGLVDESGMVVPWTGGVTTELQVWGFFYLYDFYNAEFVGECTDESKLFAPFNVSFFDDGGNMPVRPALFSTSAVPVALIDTGAMASTATIYRIDLVLEEPAPSGYSWVSIQRQSVSSSDPGCVFLWLNESADGTYDDQAYNFGSVNPSQSDVDATLCIGAEPGEDLAPEDPQFEVDVPSASELSLVVLGLILAGCGFSSIRRRTHFRQ